MDVHHNYYRYKDKLYWYCHISDSIKFSFFAVLGFCIKAFEPASAGFEMYTHLISNRKQNVTTTFKVNGQSHRANEILQL